VDQALTHVLGGGIAGSCTFGNSLTGAIVLDHLRVIHRDVGGALLEVIHWVAALAHDLQHRIKSLIGVSARVDVGLPDSIERTLVGKARRVVDKRPK